MTTTTLIANGILNQHLIDPEICIRCNTCEATCPIDAITHDDTNYVVMADKCNGCMDCISPCPTGAIDNWRKVPAAEPYPIDAQYGWDELPPALSAEQLAAAASDVQDLSQAQAVIAAAAESTGSGTGSSTSTRASASSASSVEQSVQESFRAASFGATVPPPGPQRMPTPTCMVRRTRSPPRWSATSTARRRVSTTRRTTSCWTLAPCLSPCSKANRSASSPGNGCHRPAACGTAILHRKRAQWRAPRLQQCRTHGEARDGRP